VTFPRRGGQIPYEDRADIEDLLARYANYWEFRECTAWAELFAEEGSFFDATGRVAIEAVCQAAGDRTDEERDQIHAQTNTMLVQVDEDRVVGLTNVVFGTHRAGVGGSASYSGYGDYHDVFVRTADGWRFASRRACSHLAEPLPPELR
jgi:3-phenylpropionate/cinnamic acid dioxygenase small subunit